MQDNSSYEEDEPILNKLRQEVADCGNKTPVSVLHEKLSKWNRSPKFELVQLETEGQINEPQIFQYRASFSNLEALATGASKKDAKQNAAKVLLQRLCYSDASAPPSEDTALRQEVVDCENKTPVSLLHELTLRKWNQSPKFELVETECKIKEPPIFQYRASFSNEEALATGANKKDAKQKAAKVLLQRLFNINASQFEAPSKDPALEENDDEISGNTIGQLQELCVEQIWTFPAYETVTEIGQPHKKNFVMACIVGQFREEGEGSTKKIAKRLAAYKMLKLLNPEKSSDANLESNSRDGARKLNETVAVERHITIPTAVEKLVASSDKSKSSQLSHTMGPANNFSSHFLSNFDMIRRLGKGGFGVVFEVKSKVDDCRYAIKRIVLPNRKEDQDRVKREVKTLATCDHPNIVRYFQAWYETPPPGWQEEQDKKHDNYSELSTIECLSLDETGKTESKSSDEGVFDQPKLSEDDDSFIEFRHSTANDQAMTDDSYTSTEGNTTAHSSNDYSEEITENDPKSQKHKRHLSWRLSEKGVAVLSQPRLEKMYLYIQMQLCQKQSLKEWLQITGETSRKGKIVSIFEQIVGAVEFVHLKGLIHRDLKPSNIFFALDNTIKIGDFGLVTDMEDNTVCEEDEQPPKNGKSVNRKQFDLEQKMKKHTQQVGTHLYMSPEQDEGKPYDYKVDIYSLGLILFELLWVFSTEMERIKTLTNLKKSEFPPKFANNFPLEMDLLKLMLAKCPTMRPTTIGIRTRPPISIKNIDPQLLFELPKRQSRSISISQDGEFK